MVAIDNRASSLDSTALFLPRMHEGSAAEDAPSDHGANNAHPIRDDLPVVVRDAEGEILYVQISAWRRVSAGPQRRIARVTSLDQGVAVLIQNVGPTSPAAVRTQAWHAYDADGRLTAVLQLSADQREAVLLNYQTRRACQLARDAAGHVHCRRGWSM